MRTRTGPTTMKLVCAAALSALTLCVTALPAQDPSAADDRMLITIIPRVGLVVPDAYLYEQYSSFAGDGPVEWTNGSLGRALVLGLGVELGRADGGFMLRGEVLRSFDGWLSSAHSIVVPRQLFDPPHVETTWLDARAAITTLSLQVILPTRLALWGSQPYIVAGVGGKRYDFDDPTTVNAVEAIMPQSGTTWGGDVGAGLRLPLLGFALDLQCRDAINRYWGKTEHDLIVSTGMEWRIR